MGARTYSLAITFAFFVCALVRLNIPPFQYFDEYYYVPAAGRLLLGLEVSNQQHPMLAKELIAASIRLLGNTPYGWRFASLLAGTVGLFASMRAMAAYSGSEYRSAFFGILIATSFLHFSLSRLAMLDIFTFCFSALACLALSHRRFLLCGVAIGCAVASKWSAVPVAIGLGVICLYRRQWREFAIMTGVAVATYLATFIPGYLIEPMPNIARLHLNMLFSLAADTPGNTDTSVWWEWLYGQQPVVLIDGVLGGVRRYGTLAVNPVASTAVIIGLLMSWRAKSPALLCLSCLFFWAVSGKPHQYIYSFILPLSFGIAAFSAAAPKWLLVISGLLASAVFVISFGNLTFAPLPG